MIPFNCSSEDKDAFNLFRKNHPHPHVQLRMEILWLKSNNCPHQQICELACVSPNTVTTCLKTYNEYGIEKIKEVNFYRPKSQLIEFSTTIEQYFKDHPPATIKEAMAKIEEITGIKRSETQIRKFLKSIGMRCRKVGHIPSKADIEKQERFKNEELEPRIEEAKNGKRQLFFVDAAHFVLAPFLGFLWCFTRIFIKSPSGRKRFNVLGALNAITHELINITNDTYINAQAFCDLLKKISEQSIGIPITLVLDNARYQKCQIVTELAKLLNIELLYLPSYSPNLNIIERLWKFVKKQCLYSKYYSEFSSFRDSIMTCLNRTSTKHKKELDTLLTLKFQTFKESQIMPS